MHRMYENEDLVVFWDSDKCFHAKKCVTGCPGVFSFGRKPWVDLSQAPTPDIWQTIKKCPSGALTCLYNHGIRIELEKDSHRSAAYEGDRLIGECDYEDTEEGRVIYHTEVQPEHENKGIARRLVFKVLESAERDGVKVIPTCSYAKKVLEK